MVRTVAGFTGLSQTSAVQDTVRRRLTELGSEGDADGR